MFRKLYFAFSSHNKILPTVYIPTCFKPLTPELNPSAQRCLTKFLLGIFVSLTLHFVNICVKNQQIDQLLILFINYVW
jgi:hypothetical protein